MKWNTKDRSRLFVSETCSWKIRDKNPAILYSFQLSSFRTWSVATRAVVLVRLMIMVTTDTFIHVEITVDSCIYWIISWCICGYCYFGRINCGFYCWVIYWIICRMHSQIDCWFNFWVDCRIISWMIWRVHPSLVIEMDWLLNLLEHKLFIYLFFIFYCLLYIFIWVCNDTNFYA